jgi:hypothetical protein
MFLGYPLLIESGRNWHGGALYVVFAMCLALVGAGFFVCFRRRSD